MRLAGLTGSDDEAQTLGKYFLDLYADTSWVARRGEAIHILDDHRLERRITLDLDVEALLKRARTCLGDDATVKTLLVPLTFLEKSLFLDFDLVGPGGESLHLVTSEQDSRAAQCMMLAQLAKQDTGEISPKLREKLYDLAARFPGDDLNAGADTYTLRQLHPSTLAGFTAEDQAQWATWLHESSPALKLLTTFTTHYMPIAELPVSEGLRSAMVKMRLVDPWDQPWETSRLGLGPAGFNISTPTIGRYRREHIRVLAPDGTALSGIGLTNQEAPVLADPGAALVGASEFYSRLTPERGVVYTKGYNTNDDSVNLSFTMWPQSEGFLLPALFTTLSSALLLGAGGYAEFSEQFLSEKLKGNLDAAIALLLVVPSLYSIYLSRGGEHALRSKLLRRLRAVVFGAAVAHGLAVTSLLATPILHAGYLWKAWLIGGIYCALVFLYLGLYWLLNQQAMSPVYKKMNHTSGPKAILKV